VSETFFDVENLCCKHTLWGKNKDLCVEIGSKIGGDFLAIFEGWVRYFSKFVSGQKRIHQGYDMKKEIAMYLERQVSYFFKATLPLKPATIALKIGYLAFQVL